MTRKMYPVEELETIRKDPDIDGLNFRLKHITEQQKFLESEIQRYQRCKRKYSASIKIVSGFKTTCDVIMTGGSAIGIGLMAGGITSFAGIPVMAVSLGTGVLSVGNGIFLKKLTTKIRKHEAITALAEAKLSSVKSLVSKALQDSKISDDEFTSIQQNVDDYKQAKTKIQSKVRDEMSKPIDIEKLKKDFLERGIKIGKEEKEKLTSALKN